MSETDLQLGGGYTYQWECAILLALNYFFEPVRYNPTLFDLINAFLGRVAEIRLEGEDRESGVDLEDVNLVGGDGRRRILIQVKTKQAEGERWTPTDPLLLKALYKFYDSRFFAEQPDDTRLVFLTNRPFNPTLVRVKSAIQVQEGTIAPRAEVDRLCRHLARYARKEKERDVDPDRFRKMLARTALVEYLRVDEVKANIQAKLQAQGRRDWRRAHAILFEDFSRRSTRIGGGIVTRVSLDRILELQRRVQIFLHGDFSSFGEERQGAVVDALAGLLGISSQSVEVYSVYAGSVVFDLGLPFGAVQRLRHLLQSNNGQLRLLRVEKVILEFSQGETETWLVEEGRFRLVAAPEPPDYLARRLFSTTTQAKLHGSGAIAQGSGAVAAGAGGAAVCGDVHGDIVLGDKIIQPPHLPSPTYTPPPPPDPDTLPAPVPVPPPPGSRLPFQRNDLFTGRAQALMDLAQALLHGEAGSTLVTQAVHGMGGVGKTQLAVEFACRYGRFFHGVHWINAAHPDGIGAEVAACGEAMRLPNWPAEQPEQIRDTLHEWQSNGSRLVILDNLEEVKVAREWLPQLSRGKVRVLLTARRGKWPRDLGLNVLPLDVFEAQESRAFLRKYLDEERASDEDLEQLAERLGHLPLALELAGRYLEARRLSIEMYLERLGQVMVDLSMVGWRAEWGSPTEHDLNLPRTFAVSWDEVKDETTRRLFLLAGYCAPNQPIPCELLEQAAGVDEDACDDSLTALMGLGLLRMDNPDAGPTIHPLLAEYARHQETELAPLSTLAGALARSASQANDQMDQTGSPSHFVPLLPHVRLVAETAETEVAEDAANLLGNLGYYLQRVADYDGARKAYERALRIFEKFFPPDHRNITIVRGNLESLK
jgi:tetratricopeptide (TPR) repeat protein